MTDAGVRLNIEPLDLSHLDPDQIVEALLGHTFQDRAAYAELGDAARRMPGWIPEYVAESVLSLFTSQDGPWVALDESRLTAALAHVMRATRDQATAQAAQITDLTNRLAALEAA